MAARRTTGNDDLAPLLGAAGDAWRAGDRTRAQALTNQVLARDPDQVEALLLAANLAFARDDMAGALPLLEHLSDLRPDAPAVAVNLGHCRLALGDAEDAAAAFQRALEGDADNARAWDGLGVARHRLDDLDGAARAHRRAVTLNPDLAPAWCNLGIAFTDLGDLDAARTALETALRLGPDDAKTRFNLAVVYLSQGDFARGWPLYEARLALAGEVPPAETQEVDGGLGDRALPVRAEQGFGDTIQFVRLLPEIVRRGGRPIFEAPRPLRPLFEDQGWGFEIKDAAAPPPTDADHRVMLLSLPHLLGIDRPDIVGRPYLKADAGLTARWRDRLAGDRGLRVGLAWAGNPAHRRDRARSLPAQAVAALVEPLGRGRAVHWHALLIDRLEDRPASVVDHAADLIDFRETAALIANLDLVIAVDTAVLHLAGAMGVPAWGLLPAAADWRWGQAGATTPWYDSMTLYRQPARGDWAAVVSRVRTDLAAKASGC